MINVPVIGILGTPGGVLMGMALAVILLVLLIRGIKQPLAWVVVAFIAIAGGVACAGYGVARSLLVTGPRLPEEVEWISKILGGGVGATTAGIVLLVVALLRHRKEPGNIP
jgi:hypothetical protein